MIQINCMIATPEIRELAEKLGKPVIIVTNAVATWQSLNNSSNIPNLDLLKNVFKLAELENEDFYLTLPTNVEVIPFSNGSLISHNADKITLMRLPSENSLEYFYNYFNIPELKMLVLEPLEANMFMLWREQQLIVNGWDNDNPEEAKKATNEAIQRLVLYKKRNPVAKWKLSLQHHNNVQAIKNYIAWAKEHVILDKDTHIYYIDGKPADFSVSQYYSDYYKDTPDFGDKYIESPTIGNTMDTIYRDYFDRTKDVSSITYPNLSESRKQQVLKDLDSFRKYLDSEFGITPSGARLYEVITEEEFHLVAKIGDKIIAGTPDMVVIDKDGNLHFFDMKVKSHSINATHSGGKLYNDGRDYTALQNLYRAMAEIIPNLSGKVKDLRLIWMNTNLSAMRRGGYIFSVDKTTSLVTVSNERLNIKNQPIENVPDWNTPAIISLDVAQSIIPLGIMSKVVGLEIPKMAPVDALSSKKQTTMNQQPTMPVEVQITYTPKGKTTQTYTIKGTHIYNKEDKEVFSDDSKDRRKIFANLAVQQGRAVVVENKGNRYVVNNRNQIISVQTGDIMKWGEENGDRREVLRLAQIKFRERQNVRSNNTGVASRDSYPTQQQTIDINTISDKTETFGVETSKNSEDFWSKIENGWEKNHSNGIVAYRKYGDKTQTFLPETVNQSWIGNPFSVEWRGKDTVQRFYEWLTTGNNFGNQRATDEFRQAIIQKILATPNNSPILYYTELNRPSHATVIGYLINNKQLLQQPSKPSNTFNVSNAEFYSGAADGSDKYWGEQAKALGIKVKDYTTEDWDKLSQEWKDKLEKEYQEIVQILGRRALNENTYSGKLVRRDMMQADKADAIFAVGTVASNGYIDGGTGYSSTRGIQRGIPVYVFDQNDNQWKQWNYDTKQFEVTEEPTLTPHAATIGTREINEAGKQAIQNVLNNTVRNQLAKVAQEESVFNADELEDAVTSESELAILAGIGEAPAQIEEEVNKLANLEDNLGGGEEASQEIKDAVAVAVRGLSFEQALAGQEAFFTKEEQEKVKKALNGKNLQVMSVSRLTDPAFFSKEIVAFLEQNGKKDLSDPTRVQAIEIWSKHDGLPIKDILDACKKYRVAPMMSFSITGLGGTALEGGVMKYQDMLEKVGELVKNGTLNPTTTTIRIDPILPGVTNMEDIKNIVETAKSFGIKKFVTSLVQSYGYTEGTPRDRKVVSGINNALASEGKTYDWDKYYGRDSRGKINFKPKQQYIDEIGKVLLELDKDPDITIQTCAFGIKGLKVSACLDPMIIERITGVDVLRKDGTYDRDTSRPECMCYGCHGDFFKGKNKKCYSVCAYCYAAHSGDNKLNYYNEDGTLKDNEYTRTYREQIAFSGEQVKKHSGNWSRQEAQNNPNILYVFTDNTDRDSGSGIIPDDSWYSKKYGSGHHFPTMTAAVIRGLDNARPVSTQRWYHQGAKGNTGRWTDADVEEFKSVIRDELQEIVNEFNTGKYETIMFPDGDGLFNTKISNITKERTPQLYQTLGNLLHEFGFDVLIPSDITPDDTNIENTYTRISTNNFQTVATSTGDSSIKLTDEQQQVVNTTVDFIINKSVLPSVNSSLTDSKTQVNPENNPPRYFEEASYLPYNRPNIGLTESRFTTRETPQTKLAKAFSPNDRALRVEGLARDFSNAIDNAANKLIDNLEKKLTAARDNNNAEEVFRLHNAINSLKDDKNGRKEVITRYTPIRLFRDIKKKYQDVANLTVEEANATYGGKGEAAINAAKKILDNFYPLMDEASLIIEHIESLRIIVEDGKDSTTDRGAKLGETEDAISEVLNDIDDELGDRVSGNEGWGFKERFIDPHTTVTSRVKRMLSNVILVGKNGFETDDLNNPRYLPERIVYASLMNELVNMTSSDDFAIKDDKGNYSFPALDKMVGRYPWVEQIINELYDNPELISQFYAAFRKEFIPYFWQYFEKGRRRNNALNKTLAIDNTIADLYAAYNKGLNLNSKNSIYDIHGEPVIENAEKASKLIEDCYTLLNSSGTKHTVSLTNNVVEVTEMLGIYTSPDYISAIIESENGESKIRNWANAANTIINGILNGKVVKGSHLIDTFKEQYANIAEAIGDVSETSNVLSFRQKDKSYYSISSTSFLYTMIKKFKRGNNKDYINDEYKQFDWFYNETYGGWLNGWVEELESNEETKNQLAIREHIFYGGRKGNLKEYNQWTPSDIEETFITEYWSIPSNRSTKKQYAMFNLPICSDSEQALFIKFSKFTGAHYEDDIIDGLRKVVLQELSRIKLVRNRLAKNAPEIMYFDKNGLKFNFFPEFNKNGVLEEWMKLVDKEDIEGLNDAIRETLNVEMGRQFTEYVNNSKLNKEALKLYLIDEGIMRATEDVMPYIREYFYNNAYAQTQIQQLTIIDPAFYKDANDMQKRFKEIIASGTKLFTNSIYGRKIENTIYLKDLIGVSSSYTNIKSVLDNAVSENRIGTYDRDNILYLFREVNATDAQAYRTISSYKSVIDMLQGWSPDMEEVLRNINPALDSFKNGTWTIADFNIVWQTIKPFMYTHIPKNSGLDDGKKIKVGHQNKNSEFLLLAMYDLVAQSMGTSDIIRGLNRFMEDYNIDVAQFITAVKTGGETTIDITYYQEALDNIKYSDGSISDRWKSFEDITTKELGKDKVSKMSDIDIYRKGLELQLLNGIITQDEYNKSTQEVMPTEDEVIEILKNHVLNDDGSFKDHIVHQLPYEDYVIQQPTPEHIFDVLESVFGSQFRNLLTSDLPEDFSITIAGKTLNKEQTLRLYQGCIVENLLENYSEIKGEFQSIESLQKFLISQVKGNPKYGKDILNALELVEIQDPLDDTKTKKVFNIPLNSPNITDIIQELVLSSFKNNITKQYINGGACIAVSSFGFTNELKIHYNIEGDSTSGIKYMDCYLPWTSKKLFEPFLTTVTKEIKVVGKDGKIEKKKVTFQELDVNKMPEDLKRIVGFRIPTEDKYSMFPLRIAGFLPQQNGGSIMLPMEATTLSGMDFKL